MKSALENKISEQYKGGWAKGAISAATGGAVIGSFFGPAGSIAGAVLGGAFGGISRYCGSAETNKEDINSTVKNEETYEESTHRVD